MAQLPEQLNMDQRSISFAKRKQFTISKNLAILILLAFLVCIVITALVAHYATAQADEERCVFQKHEQGTTITTQSTTNETTIDAITTVTNTITDTTTKSPTTTHDGGDNVVPGGKYLRLPTSVAPIDYDLRILTVMSNFTFYGSVVIMVNVTAKTDNITLHVYHLNVTSVIVTKLSESVAENVKLANASEDKDLQFYILHFHEELDLGLYKVSLKFGGELKDELAGYYRSSYKNGNGTRWLAATQFEATEARSAFPCFDEPALKATFKIAIGRPKNVTALSNMPLRSSQADPELDDFIWDEFERSLPMSTYLVAFIVSDFKSTSIGNFSLYARESALNQTQQAVNLGPQFLKFLEEFFDVPFPLPKMDLAAIPDFSAGAMENWGLITFRESNLLYEEGVSTKRNLQRIAIVIAHELGHQWFGNLVTPSWWTDLWLNEGFASYIEYIAVHAVHPEWKMMDQFVVDDLQSVFTLDALKSSHPISIVVNNPNEINDIFDRISYAKGATIIRMMEDFLTSTSFRKGLTNYLNEMKYKSAQQDDLWLALTTQAHKDSIFGPEITVKEVMDTWTLQMGYPVITVNRSSDGSVLITQEKFTLNRNDTSDLSSYMWWIPLTYQDKAGSAGRSWLSKGQKSLTVPGVTISKTDWLLFNLNQTGYYRVNYDLEGWSLLGGQLKSDHNILDPKNRAQIMNDALNLASAGYLDYDTALNLTTYLKSEEEYVPWKAALTILDYLNEMFQRSGHYDKFRDYHMSLIQRLYQKIGFKDDHNDPLLMTYVREMIISRACRLGMEECVSKAVTEFHNWMIGPNPDTINSISPNLKNMIYCTAISIGGEAAWNFAWERFLNANVGTEREILISALGCTNQPWLLNKYMTLALTPDSGIKKQDVMLVFRAVGKTIIGQSVGLRFVTSKWEEINKYMGKSIITTSGIFNAVTNNLNTEKELEELKTFSKQHANDDTFSQRNANQIIEQTQANIDWMKNYFDEIVGWLTRYKAEIINSTND